MDECLNLGEKLYCVLEDMKDYNFHRCDPELDFIINQLEDIKECFDNLPEESKITCKIKK